MNGALSENDALPTSSTEARPRSAWDRLRFGLRVLQVRLRFFVVLLAIFGVLAAWQYLAQITDWTYTLLTGSSSSPENVSPDTEYFCPMCPGVLSNWPEKCPVCKMPLVRRTKGDASLLPEGVLARMQLSPYRVQLAGVQTSPAQYQPLARTWHSVATIELDPARVVRLESPTSGQIIDLRSELNWKEVSTGELLATIASSGQSTRSTAEGSESDEISIRAPRDGYVFAMPLRVGQQVQSGQVVAEIADLRSVIAVSQITRDDVNFVQIDQRVRVQISADNSQWRAGVVTAVQPAIDQAASGAGVRIQVASTNSDLRPGTVVSVEWRVPLADIDPFRSMPRDPRPLTSDDVRQVFRCPDHASFLHLTSGKCPFDEKTLERIQLANNQRLEWRCPAHPDTHAKQAGDCEDCESLPLAPQIVSYSPAGHVLSIPDSAIIDTGAAQIVFVESGPGMYDAIQVQVGPICDGLRPVISGLSSEQRVVTTGAFLLDAETRLNSNVSANYFGAGPQTSQGSGTAIESSNDEQMNERLEKMALPASDLARIHAQRTCPTTQFALGSMGKPLRVRVGEHVVYLCCSGCTSRVSGAIEWPIGTKASKDGPSPEPSSDGAASP